MWCSRADNWILVYSVFMTLTKFVIPLSDMHLNIYYSVSGSSSIQLTPIQL